MKNKGFTLVELLAVIVVLAVISLISVPMILGVVEEAKKSSFKDSVLSAFDAVEYYVIDNDLGDVPENGIAANLLKMKNNNFESGRFIKNIDGNLIAEFVSDGKYCATGPLTNLNISKGECEISAPSVAVEVNGKESTITIIDENGIVAYAVTTNSEEPEEWTDIEETTRLEQNLTADSPGTYYIHVRNKYGKKITKEYVVEESAFCAYELGTEWVFDYTGGEQEFVIPCYGTYKLETWGAQGGDGTGGCSKGYGGYGGYSTGTLELSINQNIFIVVGGTGGDSNNYNSYSIQKGGYNGGGDGNNGRCTHSTGGGGGATHMALVSGQLSEIGYDSFVTQNNGLIIAGGGGGGFGHKDFGYEANGGSGGGFKGSGYTDKGGTQLGGYAFGQGETLSCASGGGSGLYGGNFGGNNKSSGGGSGYLKSTLTNKIMYCYNCEEDDGSENASYTTISTTGTNKDSINCPNGYSSDPISNCAKSGNGYAKITYIGN